MSFWDYSDYALIPDFTFRNYHEIFEDCMIDLPDLCVTFKTYLSTLKFCMIVWIITLVTTGFVGLGTILASIALSISTYFLINQLSYFYFSVFMSLFIIYCHRSNIKKMIKGTENKFKKVMIFKK